MKNHFTIKFDDEGMKKEIINYFTREMDKLVEHFKHLMISNIEDIPDRGSYSAVGALEWRQDVADNMSHNVKVYAHTIIAKAGLLYHYSDDDNLLKQALLINFGMGNLMSSANPFLKKYMNSNYYDNKRVSNNVYTRPNEEVYDYESDSYGWKLSTARTRHEIPYFRQSPSYFFDSVLAELDDEFERIVREFHLIVDLDKYVTLE